MLIRFDDLVVLVEHLDFGVLLVEEREGLSILFFKVLSDFVCHQVMRMVRSIFKLLYSTLLCHQLDLLGLELRSILISFAVKVLHADHVDVNVGKSVLLPLIAGSDGKVVEHWVLDLLLTAS